jgi:hypothetical protein
MSFVSTYNSLSVNGWSADNAGDFSTISKIATNVGEPLAMSQDGLYAIGANTTANVAGIVKVYTINNSSVLTLQANIIGNNSPNGQVVREFGTSLDIDYDGTRFVAGAPKNGLGNTQFGCARIYVRSGTSWSLEQQVDPPVGNTNVLGYATTINNDGSTIVVGQIGFGGANSEIIYSYGRSGNAWSLLASIPKPANATPNANLGSFWGSTIAMDGNNTFVSGASRDITAGLFAGAAYVYDTSGTQLAQLIPSDAAASNEFGIRVAMSNDGNTIAVGSVVTKKVYLFKGGGSSWTEVANIGNTYAPNVNFPQDISISGDGKKIFISAPGPTPTDTFVLYYDDASNSNNWTYQQTLTTANTDWFGSYTDTNSSGNLFLTQGGPGGTNLVVGNLFLLGQ